MAPPRSDKRKKKSAPSSFSAEKGVSAPSSSAPSPVAAVIASGNDSGDMNVDGKTAKSAAAAPRTVVVHPPHAPPYIRCESMEPFVGDAVTITGATAAAAESSNGDSSSSDEQLNLNLGQTIITPENKRLLWTIQFLSSVLVEWWEHLFYQVWQHAVPLSLKRKLVFGAWKIYLPLHKLLLGNRTAIHRDASLEYHALYSLMYWTRFIPISVQRMRFSLSQLHVWTPTPLTAGRVTQIQEPVAIPSATTNSNKNDTTVRGIFLHRNADAATTSTNGTIFWIYGGAFLAGDAPGNTAIADWVGQATNMDVFIPSFRLAPEANMDEILWDICLAYLWLCRRLQQEQPATGSSSRRIQLLGISSGGALCTRLMQLIAEQERNEDIVPALVQPLLACHEMKMPCGAVLLGPFVDYTPATKGSSLLEYAKHDAVVHDRVLESGLPYLETHIPHGRRLEYSPAHRNCQGLPPLCVVLSMHEAVYDMTVTLINRARRDGVPVTVGCWKYMCHVFSFLQAFIPEGRVSMEFLTEWMRQRNAQEDEAAAASAEHEESSSALAATTEAQTVEKDSN